MTALTTEASVRGAFDGKLANMLKEAGQQLALQHAGEPWRKRAIESLRAYCDALKRTSGGDVSSSQFTMEQFRVYAIELGLIDEPATLNAWGALARSAQSEGLIESTGQFAKCARPASHARWAIVWRPV